MSGDDSGRPRRSSRRRSGGRPARSRPDGDRPDRGRDTTTDGAGPAGSTARDRRRRALGQNFLVDRRVITGLLAWLDLDDDELVVEPAAGAGALTVPLARAGARVVAIELDPVWVDRLRHTVDRAGLADRVEIVAGDVFTEDPPGQPYRVVANPPFGATTRLLHHLLDDPSTGPTRVDLVVQAEVAIKRAADPPSTLLSAAWAPWWEARLGPTLPRRFFRPVPAVDAAVLSYRRRNPPVLPPWLAPDLAEALRPVWAPPAPGSGP